MPSKKHAKARALSGSSNAPKARLPAQANRQKRPHFCFEHVDTSTKESWAFTPGESASAEILSYLCDLACLSWAEIEAQQVGPAKKRKPRHHYQDVDKICGEARKDLSRRKLANTFGDAPLFRFRLSGKKRLWGFRTDRTFHVLWWDWDHKVCPQN